MTECNEGPIGYSAVPSVASCPPDSGLPVTGAEVGFVGGAGLLLLIAGYALRGRLR